MSDLQLLFENKISLITVEHFLNNKQLLSLLEGIAKQPEWREAKITETQAHLLAHKKKPMQLFSSQ